MKHDTPAKATTHGIRRGPAVWAQRGVLVAALLALVFVLVSLAQQVAAAQPAATPAKTVYTPTAFGLYPLSVSFSRYPAAAGYALPFAIAPTQPIAGTLTYTVTAVPGPGVDATPVSASLTRDPYAPNRVTGTVEITVRGLWTLDIAVDGPAGPDVDDVPVVAAAAGVIPGWVAWLIGLVPAAAIALYFLAQRRKRATTPVVSESRAAGGA